MTSRHFRSREAAGRFAIAIRHCGRSATIPIRERAGCWRVETDAPANTVESVFRHVMTLGARCDFGVSAKRQAVQAIDEALQKEKAGERAGEGR